MILDFKNKIDKNKLIEVAEYIKNGEIIVFPTETVYALGSNGLNEESIKKIYKIKNRNINKPINLIVSSIEMIESITKDITPLEYKIMENFFPGPLTIILKKNNLVPDILTNYGDTVGIRMPDDEIALMLSEYSGLPIAAPSANISNKPSGTNINDIYNDFKDNVSIYIDSGESKISIPSTIVKVENNEIKILREGPITLEEIKNKLNIF